MKSSKDSKKNIMAFDDPSEPLSPSMREDDKIPLFLIKLWNILSDPNLHEAIDWDDTGLSFHIYDPYSFSRNVLPHYFKHNNMNSFIRQLNMYGFRKMTPLDRGSLTCSESEQDHMEFTHPKFCRDQPDLIHHIKRKTVPSRQLSQGNSAEIDRLFKNVTDQIKILTEQNRIMQAKIEDLSKEHKRVAQFCIDNSYKTKQQDLALQKLFHFMVSCMQSNVAGYSLADLLASCDNNSYKRRRTSLSAITNGRMSDKLDLLRELKKRGYVKFPLSIEQGPIIADVTDEAAMENPTLQMAPQFQQAVHNPEIPRMPQTLPRQVYAPPNHPNLPPQNQRYAASQRDAILPIIPQQQQMRIPAAPASQMSAQGPISPFAQDLNVEPIIAPPQSVAPEHDMPIDVTDIHGDDNIYPEFENELKNYFSDMDNGIQNCRDLISDNWDNFDFNDIEDGPHEYESVSPNLAKIGTKRTLALDAPPMAGSSNARTPNWDDGTLDIDDSLLQPSPLKR